MQWIRERVRFVIQAFTAGDPALAAAANSPADVILVDSPDPGSGKVFDWRLAEGAPSGVRILLAGGLTPAQRRRRDPRSCGRGASTCRAASRPRPGRKDPRKLRLFIEAARAAAAPSSATTADRSRAGTTPTTSRRESRRPCDWQLDD